MPKEIVDKVFKSLIEDKAHSTNEALLAAMLNFAMIDELVELSVNVKLNERKIKDVVSIYNNYFADGDILTNEVIDYLKGFFLA